MQPMSPRRPAATPGRPSDVVTRRLVVAGVRVGVLVAGALLVAGAVWPASPEDPVVPTPSELDPVPTDGSPIVEAPVVTIEPIVTVETGRTSPPDDESRETQQSDSDENGNIERRADRSSDDESGGRIVTDPDDASGDAPGDGPDNKTDDQPQETP